MITQIQGPEKEDGIIGVLAGAVGAAGVLITSTVIVFIVLFTRCVFLSDHMNRSYFVI